MKVLVSVVSADEAVTCCASAADIVDIKNVNEGSLGASFPWIVRETIQAVRQHQVPTSAALGDLPFKPGTASLAASGLASTGVDFVKAGLHGAGNVGEGVALMKAIARACRDANPSVKVVAAGYADYRRFGGLDPQAVLEAAVESESDYVMLDTAIKDGASLFEALTEDELADFIERSRDKGVGVALAGSLRLVHVSKLVKLAPDIIGVRAAVCVGHNRATQVDATAVGVFMAAAHALCPHVY